MLRRDRHEVDRDALLPDVPRAGLRLISSEENVGFNNPVFSPLLYTIYMIIWDKYDIEELHEIA